MKRMLLVLCLVSISALAKEQPVVLNWPSDAKPVVRFTLGKFTKVGSFASQNSYSVEVTAENLWNRPIPSAAFEVYFFSKENVRIGTGYMTLNNVGAGERVKFTLDFSATGAQPTSLKLSATHVPKELGPALPPKKVRTTVYSVPAGAHLKVDGVDSGETPKQVELAVGKHNLQLSYTGYRDTSFPLEIGPDDVSGGNVTVELGGLVHDTIELRDGTSMTGDVESMDATTVVVRVGGTLQPVERNRVKRILLIEREVVAEEPPAKK